MTNPKTRKSGCAQSRTDRQQQQQSQPAHLRNALRSRVEVTVEDDIHEEAADEDEEEEEEEEEEGNCIWGQQHVQEDLHTPNVSDVDDDDDNNNDEEDEEDRDSSSSFSLQECFNEFRARRIRRISSQSREPAPSGIENIAASGIGEGVALNDPADADLINQNRSNKEHERKCKPCQNGFCYCFTSDSGEGGGGGGCAMSLAAARGAHVRHSRRSRKSDSSQVSLLAAKQQQRHASKSKERRRQSAPVAFKASPQKQHQPKQANVANKTAAPADQQLTAISRLETTSKDAPLIHIIQELRNNCVISEVRVNKQKMQAQQQRSRSLNKSKERDEEFVLSSPKKTHLQHSQRHGKASSTLPSAPSALDKISEIESQLSAESSPFISSSPLDTSTRSNDSTQRRQRHKSAGLLLQKRLSHSQIQFKPRNLDKPPPKPPRSALGFEDTRKSSVSTLASTSPSVREAELVLDDFLRKHGVEVPRHEISSVQQPRMRQKSTSPRRMPKPERTATTTREAVRHSAKVDATRRDQRKSYPLTQTEQKTHFRRQPLPTCPSLSDIERVVVATSKKSTNYEKNIRQAAIGEKPVKELSFGWNEPKIAEMLNCDTNAKRDDFRTQAKCAQPQSGHVSESIGWHIPPKIDLDTVDGNLASNIESKDTPVKTRLFASATTGSGRDSQKFIWGEQWRILSPWTNKNAGTEEASGAPKQKSNLKSASSAFLNNSKKKILRLVSPKKDNKEARPFQAPRKTPLRTVGVQTSRDDFQHSFEHSSAPLTPQSPPGSYHSVEPMPLASQQSTTTISGTSSTLPSQSQSLSQSSPAQRSGVDAETQFDFSRIVQSPPKKSSTRAGISQRKLNFPLDCSAGGVSCLTDAGDGVSSGATAPPTLTKTYRSFNSDLDQDVTLSKMGYILGNIRAKLEASDEHALRTFQEIERREQRSTSFDVPDSHNLRQETRVEIHRNTPASAAATDAAARRRRPRHIASEQDLLNEPIYSEIEEDSILFSGSPQFDNKTGSGTDGIQHFAAVHNPEALYAKVNKAPKQQQRPSPQPTALGKFLHDSMQQLQLRTPMAPLPSVPEPKSGSDDVSYTTPPYAAATLSHCQSLNNIRVMEQHSPPKLNRNLNKSDLSLHRSEIFLDNLCRSEIIFESSELERQQKVDNHKLNRSYESLRNQASSHFPESTSPTTHEDANDNNDFEDSVSYELPHEDDEDSSSVAAIAPPQSHNQSTPKKAAPSSQSFMTKPIRDEDSSQQALNLDVSSIGRTPTPHLPHNQSSSCPNTPHKVPLSSISEGSSSGAAAARMKTHATSLDEVRSDSVLKHNQSDNNNNNSTNPLSVSTLARYKRLKNALRKSLRKSKNFVKSETKRLSTSLTPHTTAAAATNRSGGTLAANRSSVASTSSFNLDTLFALDDSAPVAQQLAKAVSICRQLPDLEISPEMVEAERLLLFSSLRRDLLGGGCCLEQRQRQQQQRRRRRFFIDAMRLPVRPAASQDLFFNYFYIGVFECGGVIRSTQSVECRNNEAIFNDCGIEFACAAPLEEEEAQQNGGQCAAAVRCEIFMLRLRKVSTLSLEPRKANAKQSQLLTPSPTTSYSSSASRDEIVSRFRLHACFTLKVSDFAPFEYVDSESRHSAELCLRAAGSCSIPLTLRTKSTNLASEILLSGRAEARFAKRAHSGFLNVQEPHSQHNWNRRWCTLEGLQLRVWQDANDLQEQPLLSLELRDNAAPASPLVAAPRELCARPRSFCLQCAVRKAADADVETSTAAVFFAADTPADLAVWLQQLNAVLDFIVAWLQ